MIKVLAFDTFGTVTDWYTGISHTLARIFPETDAAALAIDWRRAYKPALAEVESGKRPWTLFGPLHRESLARLLAERDIKPTAEQLDAAVHGWHLIPGWADAAPGLARLREKFTVCSLSNGNVALLVEMARHNGFHWDMIAGADLWEHYKPASELYLGFAELMRVEPAEVLMLATHGDDLAAARSCGLQTAYIERPFEFGPVPEDEPENPEDAFRATDILALADHFGC